jgi:hypothetical protein
LAISGSALNESCFVGPFLFRTAAASDAPALDISPSDHLSLTESCFENLERNQGFKGFNQPGISNVLRIIDPRMNLVRTPSEP